MASNHENIKTAVFIQHFLESRRRFNCRGFIDADLEISGHLGVGQGAPVWILLCWGFCTAVGILKAVMKLDKHPGKRKVFAAF